MSDIDPGIREALDRFVAGPPVLGPDWEDVRSRAPRPRRSRWALARRGARFSVGPAGALALLGLIALLIIKGPSADDSAPAAIGDPGPAVTFPIVYPDPTYAINEPTTTLASLRGQVVVLGFLDDRCADCKAAADLLYSDPSAARLAVATGIPAARARAFATARTGPRAHRAIATASDPDGTLARAFGVTTLPSFIVVNRTGTIVRRVSGLPDRGFGIYLARLANEPAPLDLPQVAETQPHLAVLDDPTLALPKVPSFLLPARAPCPYVPGSLRLAATGSHGERFIVGRALDGSVITAVEDDRGGVSLGCGASRTAAAREKALQQARNRGHLGVTSGQWAGIYTFGILVLDGYDQIEIDGTVYPVPHNAFVGTFSQKPAVVVIRGSAGERRVSLPGDPRRAPSGGGG